MTELMPPYARIAEEIRRRIADGRLSPGDRVPSTRQLAKEWNVALATATKALNTLRQDGLVRTRPRAGTVVAERSSRRPATDRAARQAGPEAELNRERLVHTAVALADSEGLAALSMRGVAARLGGATMSAYRHVSSKDELVLLMADAVLDELALPPSGAPAGWRTRLEQGARTLWEVHRAHPWLAQIEPLTRPLLLPKLMAYSEWMLSALEGHGLAAATRFNLNVLLYSHVQAMAVQGERERAAESSTGLSDQQWVDGQGDTLAALTSSGAYPAFTRALAEMGEDGYDMDLDGLFELGLASLLDGIATLIEPR